MQSRILKNLLGLASALLLSSPCFALERSDVLLAAQTNEPGLLAMAEIYLNSHPDDQEILLVKGVALVRAGREEEAKNLFVRMADKNPASPEVLNNLAVIYANAGDTTKALMTLKAAIQTHPSYAAAQENMSDLYAHMAAQAYSRALDNASPAKRPDLVLLTRLYDPPAPAIPVNASPVLASAPAPAKTAGSTAKPVPPARPGPAAPVAVTPVKTSAPAAMPKPAMADTSSGPAEVAERIQAWASSWQKGDVETYLSLYSPSFSPENGSSLAQWKAQRRIRLDPRRKISVEYEALEVSRDTADRSVLVADFIQTYQSLNYRDRVKKQLHWRQSNGQWQITREIVVRKLD